MFKKREIQEMIDKGRIKPLSPTEIARQKRIHKVKSDAAREYLKVSENREWMVKHGKQYLVDFTQNELKAMKKYFNALDEKNEGSIGAKELEELLISMGLAENAVQVRRLIETVDEDRSGRIEFDEFMEMIKSEGNA
ncbi:uncharacterized calcium-binding protein B0563.7-like [Hippocampus zosterae]|uniref:uncharacterized calcium-binding protein B0563.7-like n=1 Tax=Hippocampus zosterae TaxID=109293 RepID=UPI00223D0289|nr:uncharacterized calcium-binding protein B0563.7-like [Hippocampus zosterae]